MLGGALVLVVGGFVLWLQAGLIYSIATLAYGGYGLQSHLTGAADGVQSGTYDEARAEYEAAVASTQMLDRSVGTGQLALMGGIPGVSVAVDNWRLVAAAAGEIAGSTGDLLSLYGDLSGKSGGPKIFSDGAIDLARISDLPARVKVASTHLDQAAEQLVDIHADSRGAVMLDRIRDKALKEMKSVQQAVDSLEGIAPVLPDALGANGVRRYLVAIGNQAEMRAAGGAPLSLVLVEFDHGRISIPLKGQTSTQLFPPLNAAVSWWGPGANPFFPGNPRNAPFVVTNTHPNLLFSAQEMAGAWQGGDYPPVDGVVTIDLTAIAAVLDATGPVDSAAYGTVDGAQLGRILLIDAYRTFGQDDAAAAAAGEPGPAGRPDQEGAVGRRHRLGREGDAGHGAGAARADVDEERSSSRSSPSTAAPRARSTIRARATGRRCTRRTATRARSTSSSSATCWSPPSLPRTAPRG